MPTVEAGDTKRPYEIEVPILIPAKSFRATVDLVPGLRAEMASHWPVKEIHLRVRNPLPDDPSLLHVSLSQIKAVIVITLNIGAAGIATAVGKRIGEDAYNWLKRKVKHIGRRPKKKRKR